ncbi:MAG: gliding motility-associated protein GldE [Flavobacteriales bacterium]|jgi:gliding motility-associated protein GldE|nr:MAG: gliding motility-associated protein GldE [Flavobacteriales bacterium]
MLAPDTMILLGIIGVLLVLSAALSASEVALFSLTPTQLRDVQLRGGANGRRVMDLLAKPQRLLATILIASNLVNMGVVVLCAMVARDVLDLSGLPDYMVVAVQVLVISFVIVLIGEVLPKVYATFDPVRVARWMSGPLVTLRGFFWPLSETLVRSSRSIEKRFQKRSAQHISVDSLGHALDLTRDASTTAEEQRILSGIVKFGNLEVRQVMRPRTEMVAFDKDISFAALLQAIVDSGFSRVPVYEGTPDRVIGVLYIKDVLPHLQQDGLDWHSLLRVPYFVPESKRLDDLLKEFQSEKVHLAVVVDEYGGVSGIITMEDVIEEIVGDITDEYDDENLFYSKLDDHTWVFEGKTALTDLYRVMGIDGKLFEEHKGDSGTLGGFVLELTGRIPKKGERVDLQNYTFVVEASDNKRIRRVKVIQQHETTL